MTMVLVDFSGLSWTCWEPALSAQEAGQAALAKHVDTCAACEVGEHCPNRPKQYDAKDVLLENLDLKLGTLLEAINVPIPRWVMVKDGRDPRRRQLWPAYKANREKKDYDPRARSEEHIRKKGCKFCWCPEAEADDAIATMAIDLAEAGHEVVIVSSDKDLWQLWNPPNIQIYLPVKKAFLSQAYLTQKFPDRAKTAKYEGIVSPGHVRLCKALWGDSSDNLPNAAPRMQAVLTPIIKDSADLTDFYNLCEMRLKPAEMAKLLAGWSQVLVNYEVAGLMTDVPITWLP